MSDDKSLESSLKRLEELAVTGHEQPTATTYGWSRVVEIVLTKEGVIALLLTMIIATACYGMYLTMVAIVPAISNYVSVTAESTRNLTASMVTLSATVERNTTIIGQNSEALAGTLKAVQANGVDIGRSLDVIQQVQNSADGTGNVMREAMKMMSPVPALREQQMKETQVQTGLLKEMNIQQGQIIEEQKKASQILREKLP